MWFVVFPRREGVRCNLDQCVLSNYNYQDEFYNLMWCSKEAKAPLSVQFFPPRIILKQATIICESVLILWTMKLMRLIFLFLSYSTGGIGSKFKWLISWPLLLLLFFTVPNCAKPRWEKYFMLSFLLSTLWIAIFSYFMVWMVSGVVAWKVGTRYLDFCQDFLVVMG